MACVCRPASRPAGLDVGYLAGEAPNFDILARCIITIVFEIATREAINLLQTYGYLAVFVLVELESAGIPLPGETILLVPLMAVVPPLAVWAADW